MLPGPVFEGVAEVLEDVLELVDGEVGASLLLEHIEQGVLEPARPLGQVLLDGGEECRFLDVLGDLGSEGRQRVLEVDVEGVVELLLVLCLGLVDEETALGRDYSHLGGTRLKLFRKYSGFINFLYISSYYWSSLACWSLLILSCSLPM